MNKRSLSERDICSKFITPALVSAGWNIADQVREEVSFTKGRIIVRGKMVSRGEGKRADYVLSVKPNIPIAIIEAKDNKQPVGGGMQQALDYAETLDIPFVFSSNGDGFVFHDRTGASSEIEQNLGLDEFPSPQDLRQRYKAWKGLTNAEAKVALQDYHDDGSGKEPRYYQVNAINKTMEAIAKGQDRVLLVMATGTGKTYTAFQIIWRFRQAFPGKRVLFLADRNVLIDQTMVNDFRPFSGKMAKLSTQSKTIERPDGSKESVTLAMDSKRRIDSSYEIYLGLYQAITGPKDSQKIYREFSKDFFDLIIIDECHRGSASADSAWREILDHFSSAVQIGLTATPKETEYASNIDYFGPPVYSYTLKQGIRDGFLAPYKVIKVHIDRDVQGYRPEKGQLDRDGEEVEDRLYNAKDFDRTLVLDDRTKLVAKKVSEFLRESGDPMAKTIVFCVDQEHAARMRQALINENADLVAKNARYVMRITGNDKEGIDQLGNFIDPEADYPVIVTTSKLLSTGVDAQTCRLIVLDREVGSMTEFKQIVGRGTRVHEDTRKLFFTLMDFRGASSHFADPDFDGEPVQIYQPGPDDPVNPPDETPGSDDASISKQVDENETVLIDPRNQDLFNNPNTGPRVKVYIDGVGADIVAERVEYLDENGRLVTESLRDYTRKAMRQRFTSLDDFLRRWRQTDRKHALIEELAEEGLPLDVIANELGLDLDPFDLICHIAFDAKPLTRKERAENVRKRDVFTKYGPQARAVLEALLQKYSDDGVISIDDPKILKINPFSGMGTEVELIRAFGKKPDYIRAVHEMQAALYEESA
ncbi:EcoAI/FtnUII family type I restriction enzme subunit R [Marivita geojedonensis]|uniref:Restriction endonuclease n=1 Tax=Marivita geojedonensis TaxID=1123756 RepID=A0A1X4NDJ3_9RHOB|nr:DEAD/DEAH box helicase family protein [Marivita geojedonensis]OSQ44940.1 restriction endonuclease [Marivita geojedonensis]PRY73844.1 type I restriction enzyme R subunit [Marivita geojedonensis]